MIKFAQNLLNDCIIKEFGNKTRKKIRGICKEITSDITIDFNLKFFNSSLEKIFSNPLNEKYKKRDKSQNLKEIEKIRELKRKFNEKLLINELLDMKFYEIYNMFINGNEQEIKEKYLKYGKSNKTLNLDELLFQLKKQFDDDYISNLKDQAKNFTSFYKEKKARNSKKMDKKFLDTNFRDLNK